MEKKLEALSTFARATSQADLVNKSSVDLEAMLIASQAELIKSLENELEIERMRLAACGVAALGYFDGCHPDYDSASLRDVLRLRAEVVELRKPQA